MKIQAWLQQKTSPNKRGFMGTLRGINFPVLPEKIKVKSGETTFVSYDIMNRGQVAIPTGTELTSVSWDSVFPGYGSPYRGIHDDIWWKDPKEYVNMLEDWKENGTVLTLMVTGYPINLDVYVESFEWEAVGAFRDIEYKITLVEAGDIVVAAKSDSSGLQHLSLKRSAKSSSSYTIKSGDTLWGISKKFYGTGTKWNKIYNANKTIIEKTAKARWKAAGIKRGSQNGHWIFPGVKLTIPK